jgi:hypothetical protein
MLRLLAYARVQAAKLNFHCRSLGYAQVHEAEDLVDKMAETVLDPTNEDRKWYDPLHVDLLGHLQGVIHSQVSSGSKSIYRRHHRSLRNPLGHKQSTDPSPDQELAYSRLRDALTDRLSQKHNGRIYVRVLNFLIAGDPAAEEAFHGCPETQEAGKDQAPQSYPGRVLFMAKKMNLDPAIVANAIRVTKEETLKLLESTSDIKRKSPQDRNESRGKKTDKGESHQPPTEDSE